ncbi:MAG: hypothetical protein C0418_04935 [Coriobacteriaceae bacterium]|nr:hypothetical protein [Coriobacteriaceae bacterium]
MSETGTVVARQDRMVDVRLTATEGCAHCGACAPDDDAMMMTGVVDRLGAAVGDIVTVDFDPAARGRLTALAYVPPVAGLILGYVAGFLLGRLLGADADAIGAIGALAGGVVLLATVRPAAAALASRSGYRPQVRAIISRSGRPSRPGPPDGGQSEPE